MWDGSVTDQVLAGMLEFQVNNTDPKAAMEFSYNSFDGGLTYSLVGLFMYDGPDPGNSYWMYEDIPNLYDGRNLTTIAAFVESVETQGQINVRGTFNTVATTTHSKGYLDAIKAEIEVRTETVAVLSLPSAPPLDSLQKHDG